MEEGESGGKDGGAGDCVMGFEFWCGRFAHMYRGFFHELTVAASPRCLSLLKANIVCACDNMTWIVDR